MGCTDRIDIQRQQSSTAHMAIAPHDSLITALSQPGWRDFMELTKPKVSLLIVFTAIVGMVLASPGMVPLPALVFGTLGIAMASGSAATLNHILDRHIDKQMARTRRRPLATGNLRTSQALAFAGVLCIGSMMLLWLSTGGLCALLTFGSVIGYAVIYTGWLKRATPQNIVIGGAAGAAPPVLGWVAVTHSIDAQALVLFMIIFTWTPPHFWSLAIARPALHGLAHSMHADSRRRWHEWIDLFGGRARARCALSLPGRGSSPRTSARPSHSNLSFLHHLPYGSVRCIHRRSLLQAVLVRMWIADGTFSSSTPQTGDSVDRRNAVTLISINRVPSNSLY